QEDDERSDERGHDIAQRDRDPVEVGEQPEQPEQQTADQRADQADAEVAEEAEPPALPFDDQPGEASPDQADNDPDDDLVERRHGSLLEQGAFSSGIPTRERQATQQ